MKKKLLHTPDGVRDVYNGECEKKLTLQKYIHETLKSYGYADIQTPTFEFEDIFSQETGSVASHNMYKFFDREGYTLVLRPDMTPSIARAVSKYYMNEDMPVRFCYSGNTFINHAEHQGKLKEITQIGAELVGDNKSDADAEVVAMTIDSLLKCGLEEFQVEIGHVDYFHGLTEASGLNEEQIDELVTLIENKNFFGVEAFVRECDMPVAVQEAFINLPALCGSADVLDKARKLYVNDKINEALERLERVYKLMEYYGFEKYVSFDLGTIANFDYYTGTIFRVYTYGTGNPIGQGGRYDNLLSQFGKNAPAIGFAIDLDQLLLSLNRQKIAVEASPAKTLILYDAEQANKAIAESYKLRDHGIPATSIRKSSGKSVLEYEEYCKKYGFDALIYITGDDIKRKEF